MHRVLVALTLVVGVCTAAPAPSGAATNVATIPTSIAADCSHDVTAELTPMAIYVAPPKGTRSNYRVPATWPSPSGTT